MEEYMITKLENKLTKLQKKFALCEEDEAWQILAEIDEIEGRIDMLRTNNPPSAYGFTEENT
tara:strand:- start:458 stop:643 length:186 start_codon:yes stop_codon:yes gene_type:complete